MRRLVSAGASTGHSWFLLSAVGICFLATGAAGLIYEIIWNRQLALLMGNTSYSLATLLTVFMGGLALGAWIGGRWAPAGRRALLAYGLLEIGVGVYCLILPLLLRAAGPLFAAIYRNYYGSHFLFNLIQFGVVGVLLLLPTTLMGATLPILTRFVVSRIGVLSRTVGALYALNSGGAFLGAMLCGLLLLPALGVGASNLVAVSVNLLVGLVVLVIGFTAAPPGDAGARPRDEPGGESRRREETMAGGGGRGPGPGTLLVGYGICGSVAMVYQVAWTRAVTMTIGSSTYAFTLIAGAFILGLTAGSILLGWMGDRRWGRFAVGVLPIVIGLSALMTIARLGELPISMTRLIRDAESFGDLEWAKFRSIFTIFLLPTFCMGGLLPLVCRFLARTRDDAGRSVGNAYAANAVGTILGSFSGGFVLIPLVGMRPSIMIGAGASLLVGAIFLCQALPGRAATRVPFLAFLGAVAILAMLATPRWESAVITSGPFNAPERYARGEKDSDADILQRMRKKILYYREGVSTVVTVVERDEGQLDLVVGGKPDAFSFASTQNWLGHLPMLLRPDARQVLVVGLGSGHTLGSVERHPSAAEIDCVEISPEVVFAARQFFARFTENALDDPRVRLIVGDGRLHLEHTEREYDVIISQPSNPWIAGAASLFTRECFEAMRGRLRPGGLACIWFQGFRMPTENFRVLCRTWAGVWKHCSIWTSRIGGEHLFVGSEIPLSIDFARLEERIGQPRVADQLKGIGMPTPAHVLGFLATADAGVRAVAGEGSINTDDNSRIEYDTPRGLSRNHAREILALIHSERVDPWNFVHAGEESAAYRENRRRGAQILADQDEILRARSRPPAEARQTLEAVLRRNPHDPTAARDLRNLR